MSRMTAFCCLGTLALLLTSGPGLRGQAEVVHLAVLDGPVEIVTDRWGISHIYAGTEHDLFVAQGYNAARDRLFQFELWRRQATGTVAEILGPREVKRDIGARLLRFRGDMDRELAHYHPRGREIVEAFVAGVNAYIGETEADPSLLPVEFSLLGIAPQKWTPEVVVSRHNGLYGNLTDEIDHARALHQLGPERFKELSYFHPGDPDLRLDPAIDASLLSDDILELYRAHRSPLRLEAADLVAGAPAEGEPGRLAWPGHASGTERSPGPDAVVDWDTGRQDIGSNNWVVSGRLTQTGMPLMANDPHRTQQAPSLRYWVHLVAPGWNVIGGGEPVLPGVSIGHNEHGAWGLTIFGVDIEDLYVYDTNPDNPGEYRYLDDWEAMTVVREQIAVEGQAPVSVDLKYTRHGPVLYEDAAHRKAYALRAAWLEPGAAPYLASLRMDQARTWEEFREACSYSRTPAENMVWADVTGDIGWQAVGIPPLRPNFSGLVPVPADGRYEWDGYLSVRALPHVLNPDQGFWATANHNLVPPGYPHREALAWTWADPYRASRLAEVLGSGRRHSVPDLMRLQHDELSIPARTLVPFLEATAGGSPRVRAAIDRLAGWDHVLDADSIAAGIYVAWERRLFRNVRDLLVPAEARESFGGIAMKRMIDWLAAPDGRFGEQPVAARDALLLASLDQALDDLSRDLGPQPEGWGYGQERYKHALIRHPLADAVQPSLRDRLNVGPAPRGGNGYTVNNTGSGNNQTSGASFRIIADTSDWDSSVGTNNPGQSGNPDDPHYRDLFELWSAGKYFPVLYSRARVDSAAERITRLAPRGHE